MRTKQQVGGRWEVRGAGGELVASCRTEAAADSLVGQREREAARVAESRRPKQSPAVVVELDQGDYLEHRGGYDWGRTTEGMATRFDRETAGVFARLSGGRAVELVSDGAE